MMTGPTEEGVEAHEKVCAKNPSVMKAAAVAAAAHAMQSSTAPPTLQGSAATLAAAATAAAAGEKGSKPKRFRFSVAQQRTLHGSFAGDSDPDAHAMDAIARTMSCEPFRIKNWFTNQRKKQGYGAISHRIFTFIRERS